MALSTKELCISGSLFASGFIDSTEVWPHVGNEDV